MKILGMGANPYNSRDGIIVEGCKSILNIAQFDRYVMIRDHIPQPTDEFYPDEKFDLIVYCGTPWLWDCMQESPKYANTLAVIKAHPEAKVIWLGIGSSIHLSDYSWVLQSARDQEMLRQTFKNQLVFIRDSLAHEILTKAGVEHHYLPCPSYFFNPVCQTKKEYDVMFYHAPRTGISAGYWTDQRLTEYNGCFEEFYYLHREAKLVVCEPNEINLEFFRRFGKNPQLITDPIDTFNICKNARKVLSGRIHNAVPSLVYGADVGIVPVDSRAKVITDFFDIGVNNPSDLSKIKSCDILKLRNDNIETYRSIIKDYLK